MAKKRSYSEKAYRLWEIKFDVIHAEVEEDMDDEDEDTIMREVCNRFEEDYGFEFYDIDENCLPIQDIKKGEFVRLKDKKKTYINNGWCRTNRKYELVSATDISDFKYIKKSTLVDINFEY